MRTARLALLGLALALLSACGAADLTAPDQGVRPDKEAQGPTTKGCGYLGSSGCP